MKSINNRNLPPNKTISHLSLRFLPTCLPYISLIYDNNISKLYVTEYKILYILTIFYSPFPWQPINS